MIAGNQLLMPGVVTGAGRSPPDSPAKAIDQRFRLGRHRIAPPGNGWRRARPAEWSGH
jgi:hypothetical protein